MAKAEKKSKLFGVTLTQEQINAIAKETYARMFGEQWTASVCTYNVMRAMGGRW